MRGFGANTSTPGGFGTSTAGTAGGFGTNTAGAAGGFGTNTAGTAGGFGTNTAGTAGGFGTNTAGTAGGFGTNTAGAAGGFGSTLGGQTQLPPYKGIKGPGFSTDWARSVNFSTLRDDVLFEELPPPLQQHLMELHTFIQAEREAKRFVETFLTDSMGPPPTGDSSSYKELQKKLCKLTTGENAVDGIRVDCFEREVHGRHLSMLLEKCEEEVIEYSKNVWEPLAEGFTHRCSGNRAELPSELFHRCLRDIQSRMEEVSAAVRELELAVVPNAQRQKRVTDADNTNANAATEASSPGGLFPRYTSEMSPLDTTAGLRQSVASHPIAQMNATLSNELATLLNLAAWTSRLHTRADAARDLFAHLYGTSEAEVLLAQQQRQIPVGPKRPFSLRSSEKSSFSDVDYDTIGDIHRRSVGLDRLGALGNGERRMQYDVLLERQRQALAPASTTTVITATTTTPGFSVPAVGGAATTTATTTAGTAGGTAASAPVGGFGLSTTSTGGFGSTSKTSGLSGTTTFKSGRT